MSLFDFIQDGGIVGIRSIGFQKGNVVFVPAQGSSEDTIGSLTEMGYEEGYSLRCHGHGLRNSWNDIGIHVSFFIGYVFHSMIIISIHIFTDSATIMVMV